MQCLRKFKSFQKEKQEDKERKEAEERQKSWVNKKDKNRNKKGGGGGTFWHNLPAGAADANDATLNRWRREWEEAKIKQQSPKKNKNTVSSESRDELLKIFPSLDFDKLKTYALCRVTGSEANGWGVRENHDYEVVARGSGGVTVINDEKKPRKYPDHWFRPTFVKYDFKEDVYVECLQIGLGLTNGKFYNLIGETRNGYEMIDDKGRRQNQSKSLFGLPQKLN